MSDVLDDEGTAIEQSRNKESESQERDSRVPYVFPRASRPQYDHFHLVISSRAHNSPSYIT